MPEPVVMCPLIYTLLGLITLYGYSSSGPQLADHNDYISVRGLTTLPFLHWSMQLGKLLY